MIFQEELIDRLRSGGEKIAIEQGCKRMSYAQLSDQANAITAYLLDRHLPAEAPVGILLEERIEMIVAMIGIINARGTFVFLDARQSVGRLAAIQRELKLEHIIVSDSMLLPEPLREANIHRYAGIVRTSPGPIVYPGFSGEDSIYVYFTSGSTGTPKGIVGKNKSLLQFLQWEIAEFGIGSDAKFSQFITPVFDAFLRDIFTPLLANGIICIPPPDEDFFTSEKLMQWIDANRVTHIHCVPSLFMVINNGQLTERHFGALRYVFMSGEKINPSALANWYRILGDRVQLVNFYGATETTMIRSSYRIQPADVEKVRIPVGKPIAETEFLIMGQDLKPLGISLVGELYVLTEYMTWGYLNASPSDRERFMEIEYKGKLCKAFRSGDKARRLPGGNFELLGREDRMIKLRGIRVELDEVEAILHQGPGVKQVAVILAGENLAAFVIGSGASPGELEAYAKQQLPVYMVPSAFVEMHEFPLLPNGKVNYILLAEALKATHEEIVPPANPLEEQLLCIWTEILGDKPISATSSFHTIGGNSLGMMRLIGKIYKQFGVRISLIQLFNHLTIQQQAGLIQQATKDNVMTIGKAGIQKGYALSAAQERIYYTYKLDPAGTAYNLPLAWEVLEGETGAIEALLNKLIGRHESLRTQFVFEGDQVYQSILEEAPLRLTELYCKDDPEAIRQTVLSFIQPFDLSMAPLFRAAMVFAGEKRRILIIDTHHIVCDGMSQVNIMSEFVQLQQGRDLPPLNIQYKDYAEWERKFKGTPGYLSQREFWLKSFEGGIPKLQLPVPIEGSYLPDRRGASIGFTIGKDVWCPVFEILKEHGITEFSGMFAIYFIFLSQISGQDDIVIGTNTSGRMQEELMGLVGMFAKTLPIRLRLHPEASFLEFARSVHRKLVEANAHQLYDLSDIVSELRVRELRSSADLISTMFVFQNFEIGEGKTEGMRFSDLEFDNPTSKYPLSLFVSPGEETFQFRFEYSSAFFSREDMLLLTAKFKELIHMIPERTDRRVVDYWEEESEAASVREDVSFNFGSAS